MNPIKRTIDIPKEFSKTPGPRERTTGDHSGEEFREDWLVKYFIDPNQEYEITLDFDGAYGYPTSFLEECFGGLVRKFGMNRVLKVIKFGKRNKFPMIEREIKLYMQEAED